MKAVVLEVPESLLEERRRRGADRWDEMWDGVLHMVPPPSGDHQRLGGLLFRVMAPLADAAGLVAHYETGLFRPGVDRDYRVPDHTYARPDQVSRRGVEGGAPLVVEIRSPGDESYEKLDWFAAMAVGEVLVIEPDTRAVELFALRGDRLVLVQAGPDGVALAAVAARLATRDGPVLEVTWDGGAARI
ncbi:MAG: Uma2 family endonuclease [Acidimicrobiales bacterium]